MPHSSVLPCSVQRVTKYITKAQANIGEGGGSMSLPKILRGGMEWKEALVGRGARKNDSWELSLFQHDVRTHKFIYNLFLIASGCYSCMNTFTQEINHSANSLADISFIIMAKLEITQIFKSQVLVKHIITYPYNGCMWHIKMFHNSIYCFESLLLYVFTWNK